MFWFGARLLRFVFCFNCSLMKFDLSREQVEKGPLFGLRRGGIIRQDELFLINWRWQFRAARRHSAETDVIRQQFAYQLRQQQRITRMARQQYTIPVSFIDYTFVLIVDSVSIFQLLRPSRPNRRKWRIHRWNNQTSNNQRSCCRRAGAIRVWTESFWND